MVVATSSKDSAGICRQWAFRRMADGGRLGRTTPALEERQQLLLQAAGQQHQPLMAEQAQPNDHRVDVALPLPAMLQMLA